MALSNPARLLKNIIWNGVGRLLTVAISLFLTPYLLAGLGIDTFGLWALANLLIGYMSLADLGIQASLVRQISFAQPDQDPEKFSEIVSTSFYFYVGLFALTAPFAVLLGPHATDFAARLSPDAIPAELMDEARFVVTFVASTVFLSVGLAVFSTILPAVQRMDLSNQVTIGTSVLNLLVTVAVLESGYGIRELLVASFGVKIVTAFASYLPAKFLHPALRVAPRAFSWRVWRELYTFGSRIFVSRMTEVLTFTFDRLFVTFAAGVEALGRYQPAVQAATQSRILPYLLVAAALPYASELSAQKERKALLELYYRGNVYLAFFAFGTLGFVAAAAPVLVRVWLGPNFDDAALWIRILTIGYLVNAPLSLGGLLSQAIGRPGVQTRSAILGSVLNVTLSPLGYYLGGITGLTLGATLSVVGASVWFFWKLHQVMQLSSWDVIARCFAKPAAWLLPSALAIGLALAWLEPLVTGRGTALIATLGAAALYTAIAALGATSLKLWNVRDQLAATAPAEIDQP